MTTPITQHLLDYLPRVFQEPDGYFAHPYITPTPKEGVYGGMLWDWDSLLCGYGYLAVDPARATRALEGVVRNVLEHLGPAGNGTMALVATAPHYGVGQGSPPELSTIRPVVGQMAYLVSAQRGDAGWLAPLWPKLKRVVDFYHRYRRHDDLYTWSSAWESCSDNNPALWNERGFDIQACDMCALVYQEFRAMAWLAAQVGDADAAYDYTAWARNLQAAVNTQLYDAPYESYFNRNRRTGERLRRITYTNFGPFWGGIAEPERAKAVFERYLLNPDHLWCNYGIRTLSARDMDYNTASTIAPSNWRGPVWFVANYFTACALRRYGFPAEALTLVQRTLAMLNQNIEKYGFVSENFHPDTGDKLMAEHFISWTSIALRMEADITSGTDIFSIPEVGA